MRQYAALFLCMVMTNTAFAQQVNLWESTILARSGFDEAWTRGLSVASPEAWTTLDPNRGERVLEARRWGLPGMPPYGRFSMLPMPPQEFTVLVPFQSDAVFSSLRDPALFLPHVGQSWAVYLNGTLLRDEFVRPGEKHLERSLRDVIVPLDRRLVIPGQNLIAFRLRGDPSDDRTGFNMVGSYTIESYAKLAGQNHEYLDLMLIGIYSFFGLYHILLFALRPKDKSNLYFGLSTLLLASYIAMRTTVAPELLQDTSILRRIEYVSLFMALPAVMAFLESVLHGRVSRFTYGTMAVTSAMSIVGNVLRLEPFLYIWYFVALAAVVHYFLFTLVKALARDFKVVSAGRKPGLAGLAGTIGRLAVSRDPGRLAIGSGVLVSAVFLDSVAASTGGSVSWSKFAFLLFILTTASVLARGFAEVTARAEAQNDDLEREVESRTAALRAASAERSRLNAELAGLNQRLETVMAEADRDVRMAAAVQKGFFPTKPPAADDWDCAFVFEPAVGISGDFYDLPTRDSVLTGALVATVSGRGVASGLVTVLAKNIFSRGMDEGAHQDLGSALKTINRELIRELSTAGATISCVYLRLAGSRMELVNSAHPDALIRRAGHRETVMLGRGSQDGKAAPLGRGDFEDTVTVSALDVSKGDVLLLHSHGLTASVNIKGESYGQERLARAFAAADQESAESILASVMIDYRKFTYKTQREHDVTVVTLMRR
jgi:phosphoserine phosphatase RsbU/P